MINLNKQNRFKDYAEKDTQSKHAYCVFIEMIKINYTLQKNKVFF
jgi:hypothetical protein